MAVPPRRRSRRAAPLASPRVAGALLALSIVPFLASLFAEASSARLAQGLRIVALLMQVPAAMALGAILAPRGLLLAMTATAAGVASLLLWAGAGILLPWSMEWLYLALSALWWLGLGLLWPREQKELRLFTLLLGVVAAADVAVTLAYERIPFWVFAVAGGPKIPLSLVWAAWVGVVLARGRLGLRR